MKGFGVVLFAIFVAVVFADVEPDFSAVNNAVNSFKATHHNPNDEGHMVNCGKQEGGSDFTFTWSPARINPNQEYTISVTGKASVGFVSGTANLTVWIKDYPQPVFQNAQKVTCAEAVPFAKGILKCPIKPGDGINVPSYSIKAPSSVSQVPPGTYTVQVRLTNESNKLFVCAKGDITVGNQ